MSGDAGRGLLDVVSRYTQTFLWLQRYDEGLLEEPTGEPGGILPSADDAMVALAELKRQLAARGEATDLFAQMRDAGLAGILGNLDQSVFGQPAYPTVESKAAHLLYFVVKNHPFADDNKRSGAFLFLDFLHRNGRLLSTQGQPIINDTGLAALTLLVAESDLKQKDTLIRLIVNIIGIAVGLRCAQPNLRLLSPTYVFSAQPLGFAGKLVLSRVAGLLLGRVSGYAAIVALGGSLVG